MSSAEGGEGRLRQPPVAEVTQRDAAVIVRLQGELDLYNAHEVRQALVDAADREAERVVVDLAAVEFIDSTALGVLVEGRARLTNRRAFLLAAPGGDTRRALEVSGLARHLSVHATVDDAIAAAL